MQTTYAQTSLRLLIWVITVIFSSLLIMIDSKYF